MKNVDAVCRNVEVTGIANRISHLTLTDSSDIFRDQQPDGEPAIFHRYDVAAAGVHEQVGPITLKVFVP